MDILVGLILLIVVIWAVYSLVGVIRPVRPFATRGRAAKSFGLSFAAFLVGSIILGTNSPPKLAGGSDADDVAGIGDSGDDSSGNAALTSEARLRTSLPEACGEGGIALRDIVAVTGSHELRASADPSAPKLRNEKASRSLGEERFHQIDSSTTVRRLCVQMDWTEIQITTPEWLTHVHGWVPNAALREIGRSASGQRLYVEEDFYWDNDTAAFKPEIVAVVNKLARENKNCPVIDTASVARSPSRSKPGDPMFFVTCGAGNDVFNVWFRPTDADTGRTFTATEPLGREAAVQACENAARAVASHPSTVDFSRVRDLAYLPHASGRARVVSTFTAKNGFNLELKYRISCLFDGKTLIETQFSEALD